MATSPATSSSCWRTTSFAPDQHWYVRGQSRQHLVDEPRLVLGIELAAEPVGRRRAVVVHRHEVALPRRKHGEKYVAGQGQAQAILQETYHAATVASATTSVAFTMIGPAQFGTT